MSQSCTSWRRSGYLCEKIIRGANIITPQGNQGAWCSGCLWKRILSKLPWQERGGYQMSAATFLPVFPVNRLLMTFFFVSPAETIRCQPCKTLLRWASCHSETAQQLFLIKAIVVVSRRRIMGQFIGHCVVFSHRGFQIIDLHRCNLHNTACVFPNTRSSLSFCCSSLVLFWCCHSEANISPKWGRYRGVALRIGKARAPCLQQINVAKLARKFSMNVTVCNQVWTFDSWCEGQDILFVAAAQRLRCREVCLCQINILWHL